MTTILGLTGSIGMGKSTTAQMFRDAGIPVWDADAAVHALYAPTGPAPKLFHATFPGSVGPDGHVDRAYLRTLIAKDPGVLDQINAIIHPLVAQVRADFLKRHNGLVVLDVPLLFETGLEARCDKVAVVSVDAKTQKARVLARGTMTDEDFDAILSRQVPDAEKRRKADYIIDTSTIDVAQDAVNSIIAELT
ncbi:dephospho-CoA kinase [Gymnodinialimonas ulvae]|uniref:dephospho-CoA kinase n=1 Tax=Gymnodinialimonas ulvae TaxID=3126504 RepID=UPI003095267B